MPDLRQYLLVEVNPAILSFELIFQFFCYFQVFLKVWKAQFVARFIFSKVGAILLNGIIREMHVFVVQSCEAVFFRASS